MTFQKSYQSFLRIELTDRDRLNKKVLRPYNQPIPAKMVIRNDGYKRFQNITVQTKVGFRIAYEIRRAWPMRHGRQAFEQTGQNMFLH